MINQNDQDRGNENKTQAVHSLNNQTFYVYKTKGKELIDGKTFELHIAHENVKINLLTAFHATVLRFH